MKFEKRSGDEAETPSSAPEETPSTGKKPVVIYIMILFIVAFLLMALSFLMHQRSNSEVIGELQDSVTAMQEVQATQDALLGDPRVKGFKTTKVVDVEVTDGKLSAALWLSSASLVLAFFLIAATYSVGFASFDSWESTVLIFIGIAAFLAILGGIHPDSAKVRGCRQADESRKESVHLRFAVPEKVG